MNSYNSKCNMRRNVNPYMPSESNQSTFSKSIEDYPIAMAYVPWQHFHDTYELSHALCVGTIFPELNKPFLIGKCVKL